MVTRGEDVGHGRLYGKERCYQLPPIRAIVPVPQSKLNIRTLIQFIIALEKEIFRDRVNPYYGKRLR